MTIKDAGPQEAYVDNQNYDVDIEKIYNNFIVEIDKIRSHVSVQNNPSLNDITTAKASQTPTNINVDQVPQESRCHAFYRLLGLPVTDGVSMYTPGYDKNNNSNKTINDSKLKIAQKLFENKKVKNLLDTKENSPRDYAAIFSNQDVNSIILTMSLAEVRPINASFNKIVGIFDTDENHQKYDCALAQRLQSTITYNSKVADKVSKNRSHILTPLIVDPRIDFNVYPKRNMLAVPFLKDKSDTILSDGIYLKRPYIEKVCRDRLDTRPKVVTLGTATQGIIDNIKTNPFIKDNALIQKAFDPAHITSETTQFANYFNSIRSVLVRMYESVNKLTPVLAADPFSNGTAAYNWMPIPSKTGPEGGCTTRDLLSDQSDDPNNTFLDKELLKLLYAQGLANISNKLTSVQDPDVGSFAFDGTELTPDNNSSDSMGDLIQSPIDSLVNDRKNFTDAANDAARTIEIILGEFSGLGLLDILVISSAFWVTDKKDLLGLLDDIAINRMLQYPYLQATEVKDRQANGPLIGDSLLNFQTRIKEIYDICSQLWLQIQVENGR